MIDENHLHHYFLFCLEQLLYAMMNIVLVKNYGYSIWMLLCFGEKDKY